MALYSYGVTIELYIMEGEYDAYLKWPFEKKVRVTLLNKRTDDQHHKIERYFKGNKASQLKLRDVNTKQSGTIKQEYEQLLKKTEPTMLCQLLNMYCDIDQVRSSSISLLYFLDEPLILDKESKVYFEVVIHVD